MELSRRRSVGGPPLMLLLVGLAMLPLLSGAWFGAQAYQEARRSAQTSRDIGDAIVALEHLDGLRLALIDEGNWLAARRGVDELGISTEFVATMSGVDLDVEVDAAKSRVDAGASTAQGVEFVGAIDEVRSFVTDEQTDLQARYGALEQAVARRAGEVRIGLWEDATAIEGGGEVFSAMQAAEAATTARLRMSQLVWTYFRAEFSVLLDAAPDYVELVRLRDSFDVSLDTIEDSVGPGTELDTALTAFQSSPARARFLDAVDDVIVRTFDRDERLRDDDVDVAATALAGAETFRAGIESVPALELMAELASGHVAARAEDTARFTSTEFARRVATIGILATLSLLVAVALARYVGRPMNRIGDAAGSLGSGAVFDENPGGPREVRRVAAALSTAAAGLALVERLEHLATHDDLTGIPGRRHFLQRLDAALSRSARWGSTGALLFVDLDHFKEINDTHGHLAGDLVLRTVAERIGALLRLEDDVARYGGDEFVVLAESVVTGAEAMTMANRIIDTLSEPIPLDDDADDAGAGAGVTVSASVGVALFDGDSRSADQVISRADDAVYRAKHGGRSRAVMCDELVLAD